MARYFFHLRSEMYRIPDEQDRDFADLAAANNHARQLIQKVIFHVGFDNERDWRLVVSAHTPAEADLIVLFPNPLEQVLTPKSSLTQRLESNSI